MVSVAIDLAVGACTRLAPPDPARPLAAARTVVVGAGSMSALAATTADRAGAAGIVVLNRSPERRSGSPDRSGAAPQVWPSFPAGSPRPTLLSRARGPGMVITAEMARNALAARGRAPGSGPARGGGSSGQHRGPVVFIDLALPRDVDEPSLACPVPWSSALPKSRASRGAPQAATRRLPATRTLRRSGGSSVKRSRRTHLPCTRRGCPRRSWRCARKRPAWWTLS